MPDRSQISCLAIVIFAGLFAIFGKQSSLARVDSIQPGSAAEAAGFQPGDIVRAIDGRVIGSFAEMQRIVSTSAGETLSVTVDRGGSQVTLKATPALREVKDNFGNTHRIGVLGISRSMSPDEARFEPVDPLTAVWLGVKETWFVVEQTMTYICRVFVGPGAGGPAWRSNPNCTGVRAGGDRRAFRRSYTSPQCCRCRLGC